MIDKDLIEAKFDIIEKNLKFIEKNYKGKIAEEIEKDYRDYQALKFSLFETIEACIDIANHIIAGERLERVEEYAKMFLVLGKNGIISKELAGMLAKMAKFRNFLIHRYGEVNTEYIVEIVNEHLKDIVEYIKEIRRFK